MGMTNDAAFQYVRAELEAAMVKYPEPFHSAHEGFAFMDEERDELWEEVKVKQGHRNTPKMQKEAIQVAAMAIRFLIECSEDP